MQGMAVRTDPEWVKLVWRNLDKTDFPLQSYQLFVNILRDGVPGAPPRALTWRSIGKIKDLYEVQSAADLAKCKTCSPSLQKHLTTCIGIWCPVMRDFCRKKDFPAEDFPAEDFPAEDFPEEPSSVTRLRKLAHILPHRLGSKNLAALLGYAPDQDPMNMPSNLMYLDHTIEAVFDQGQVTFVPAHESQLVDRPMEYKMIVVDESLLQKTVRSDGQYEKANLRWKHLDRKELLFRNANRPGKRHLYLHNVLSLLRSQGGS